MEKMALGLEWLRTLAGGYIKKKLDVKTDDNLKKNFCKLHPFFLCKNLTELMK